MCDIKIFGKTGTCSRRKSAIRDPLTKISAENRKFVIYNCRLSHVHALANYQPMSSTVPFNSSSLIFRIHSQTVNGLFT